MASIAYLTLNSVQTGVGASQVWEYVRRLPDYGHQVNLTSFEQQDEQPLRIPDGVSWRSTSFGTPGAAGGLARLGKLVSTAARSRNRILHARSDLPAVAALMVRHPVWVWDMRSFWREQRIVLGTMSSGGVADKGLQQLERLATQESSAIICLAEAAKETLRQRYGDGVAGKTTVIPTAVDTDRFLPEDGFRKRPRVLISGSYNGFYDGALTIRFLDELAARRPISTAWVGASPSSPWFGELKFRVDEAVQSVPFTEMPQVVSTSDAGLALCRLDAGVSLTGAMPTKVAEFLSAGVPVVVTRGTGDLEDLVDRYRCGAVVRGNNGNAVAAAADELVQIWSEPDTKERCRACALEIFNIDRAVEKLSVMYEGLAQ